MIDFIFDNLYTIVCAICWLVMVIVSIIMGVKGRNMDTVKAKILEVMEYVEQYRTPDGSALGGDFKLALAKSLMIQECKERHISYDDKFIGDTIETLVKFTKKVNYKGDETDGTNS